MMTDTGTRFYSSLTAKQKQIIVLIAEGQSNAEIAGNLHTTEQVIKNYVHSIMDLSGMDNRHMLTIFMFHHHIIQCPCGVDK